MLARALPLGAWGEATIPDWGLFASALMIAVIAALLIAVVPTVSLWRGDLRGVLGRVRTGGFEGRGGRLENGLVVAEVALAVVITSGAALLTRSVTNLYAVDPGVRTEGVAVVDASTCLLACEKSNVVVVQPARAARHRGARPVWLREVLDAEAVDAIAGWVRAGGPGVSEVPPSLAELVTTPGVLGEAVL